jgi:hypothetical protein
MLIVGAFGCERGVGERITQRPAPGLPVPSSAAHRIGMVKWFSVYKRRSFYDPQSESGLARYGP